MTDSPPEQLGPPSVRVGLLEIWVRGRQFPDSQDRWDSNWLNVVVHCEKDGASVWTSGAILDVTSVMRFREGLNRIYQTLDGEAVLESHEPNVRVHVGSSGSTGHFRVHVEITPDHLRQGHWFEFEADQSYLPPVLDQLDTILKMFPARGLD